MKPELTRDGVEIQTLSEILEELSDGYRAIYGDDINLGQDTPDGQRVGLEAKLLADLQLFAANLYAQFDPDFSVGEVQNKIFKISGVTRNPATRSSVEMTITTDQLVTLPEGYTIKDYLGQNWVTTEESALVVGANSVSMFGEFFGAFEADPGTITEPVTIVLGVISVTNALAAVPGLNEETDEEARIRRNQSLENPSYSTVGSLFAKLANLEGVLDLQVYENDTDTPDQLRDNNTGQYVPSVGMPAHAIWVVIDGGDSADIVETMAKQKTSGTPMRGATSGVFLETLIRPDGSSYIITHVMNYGRPADKDLYIQFDVKRKDPAVPIDITLIKQTLADQIYRIRETIVATELYSIIYSAGTNFTATSIMISDDDITYTDETLTPDFDEKFTVDVANIDITEIF
mgnify:CR=1 FL=1